MFRRRRRVQVTRSGIATDEDSVETVRDSDGLLDVDETFAKVMAFHRRRSPWSALLPGMKRGVRSMLQAERDREVAERGGDDDTGE